jgi:mono/diheme cytochrome c family protein
MVINRRVILFVLPVLLASLGIAQTSKPSTAPARTVWDGVYSRAQSDRGKKAYDSLCARCHGETFGGNDDAPALVDEEFLKKWEGKSVGALVEYTRKEMPSDGPGVLNRAQSTDIIAFLLNVNSFPAGSSELPPELDPLNAIQIKTKK